MKFIITFSVLTLLLASANFARATDPAPAPAPPGAIPLPPGTAAQTAAADARREQAIAQYAQKMKDASYPGLFDQAEPILATALAPGTETDEERIRQRKWLLGLIVALLVVGMVYLLARKRRGKP